MYKAIEVLDIVSGNSLILRGLMKKWLKELLMGNQSMHPPLGVVVISATFPLPVAAEVEIKIVCVKMKGKRGIISDFPFNVLLGVDFQKSVST